MSVEQWTLLSNVSHYYDDEQSGLAIGEAFARDQNLLHPKFRYKSRSLMKFFEAMLNTTPAWYQNNPHFRSLSSADRSLLVHRTPCSTHPHCSPISLLTKFDWRILPPISIPLDWSVIHRPYPPLNVWQVDWTLTWRWSNCCSLSSPCSTTTFAFYSNTPPQNLSNVQQVLDIQGVYIDLLWRYLVYQYNDEEAVRCLSNLVRCLFAVNDYVVQAFDVQWYTDAVDGVVEQTKRSFIVNNWTVLFCCYVKCVIFSVDLINIVDTDSAKISLKPSLVQKNCDVSNY